MSRTISIWTKVDVSLDDFEADDLREELRHRVLSEFDSDLIDPVALVAERSVVERARMLALRGDFEPACRLFGDLIRDAMGTAI